MKNNYEVKGETTVIFIDSPTYGMIETLIDTEDLKRVSKASTIYVEYDPKMDTFYAKGLFKGQRISLHRYVLKVFDTNKLVDHINHDTLDNRKKMLREVTYFENNQNARKRKDNTSGYTGVQRLKSGKWHARIMVNGKRRSLGTYEKIEDAVAARVAAELEYSEYVESLERE